MDLALSTARDFAPLLLGSGGLVGILVTLDTIRRAERTVRRTLKLLASLAISAAALVAAVVLGAILFL
ncbi:hypothetical protein AB1285_21920 [Microbacterium sp. NRRL B-14842]|uniref:hypothetical protein n=1 Tax=Microbacterium TaxID=33882 RepID=UPI001877BA9F|nr:MULTISPECIES: hypothetical protein [unclassified Microbacterium]MBS0475921.1 hypothetical protein [Pseudomonadota bacterium]